MAGAGVFVMRRCRVPAERWARRGLSLGIRKEEKMEARSRFGRSLFAVLFLAVASPAFGVTVLNHSFESPDIDPATNPFLAVPFVDNWTQTGPMNTSGVFHNTEPTSTTDHVTNMDGTQAAFMSGSTGIMLSQLLGENFLPGNVYDLRVNMGVSASFPPAPTDLMELVFFYMNGSTPVDVNVVQVGTAGLSPTLFVEKSNSFVVNPGDAWENQPIGIAFRSSGGPNGFWDLDNLGVTATPVPEPMSLGVLALAGAGLLLRRRRA
jgi:hypothetical protein